MTRITTLKKLEESARKAVELTDLCMLHMEYHGQKTKDCTPQKRTLYKLTTPPNKGKD